MVIRIANSKEVHLEDIVGLYHANKWSSANKPEALYAGLMNSDVLITAWDENRLVGLGNSITDGHLVVYYPHLLVHPDYHRKGIGRSILKRLQAKYRDFHQQALIADGDAISFYKKCGFERAGQTEPLWIYQGNEH